jgi:hypothetical protein
MKAFGRRGVLLLAIAGVSVLGTAGTASAASINETDLEFGNQNIGTPSAPQVLNVSPDILFCIPGLFCVPDPSDTVSAIGVTGPFAQINTCTGPSVFAPCTITVTHVPTGAGPSVGTLTADGDTVNLRGTGVDPNAPAAGAGDVVKQAQVSNQFSFGTVKFNKENGTAQLTVDVPGPGNLALGGNGVVKKRLGGASASKAVGAAGKVSLLIKAKGRKKQKLNDNGKVTVRPKITFSPTGGTPATQTKRIVLKKNV